MSQSYIPFNKAHIAGKELYYIAQAVSRGELKGDGPFTHLCNSWLEETFGVARALLTHSCTAALEMSAHLLNLRPGDEVILPSFTFTSTANAFVLRGVKPIFADIRPDTLNIDENLISALITPRTKAICVVHYAGVACEMDTIMDIATDKNIAVVEDAAQAIMSTYKKRYLGTIGSIGTFSFHETKNFSSGEGGAILLNDPIFIDQAEIIREKGTDRSRFFRGEVDKYTWVGAGSSYLPSEIIAAFLFGQLEQANAIQSRRLAIWNRYYETLKPLEEQGAVRLPIIPDSCQHNAHLFYLLFNTPVQQRDFLSHMGRLGIGAVFHYSPLHLAPMGRQYGYKNGDLPITERVAECLVRLPIFCDIEEAELERVIAGTLSYFEARFDFPVAVNI